MQTHTYVAVVLLGLCCGLAMSATPDAVPSETPQNASEPADAPAEEPADMPSDNSTTPGDTPSDNSTTPDAPGDDSPQAAPDSIGSPDDNSTEPADSPLQSNSSEPEAVDEPVEAPNATDDSPFDAPNATAPSDNATTPGDAPNATAPGDAPNATDDTPANAPNATAPGDNATTPSDSPNATTPVDPNAPVPKATPVDAPADPPADAPNATVPEEVVVTPPTVPNEAVKWCTSDAVCTSLGDTSATCNTDTYECTCGAGFGPVTEGNVTAYLCVQPGSGAVLVEVVLSLVFNIPCETFDLQVHGTSMRNLIEQTTGGTTGALTQHCGSLIIISQVQGVNAVTIATLDVRGAMNAKLNTAEFASLLAAVGTVSSATSDVGGSGCVLGNAAITALLPSGECIAVTCNPTYTVRNNTCVPMTATVTPTLIVSDDDDDGLPPGAIVGIVVGVLAGCALLVALICVCSQGDDSTPGRPTPEPEHDRSHEPDAGERV
eukprot:TRINITY_DN1565_c0_g1_i3.p1 TRINITY_DN1565_c0_g1~~TRINITY_DN1565_c0_g1_i3.p1  ORF type:complete len:507 (+),score=141.98 TRINITY_DN1565_c0_g1_i3:49-1521(+)